MVGVLPVTTGYLVCVFSKDTVTLPDRVGQIRDKVIHPTRSSAHVRGLPSQQSYLLSHSPPTSTNGSGSCWGGS